MNWYLITVLFIAGIGMAGCNNGPKVATNNTDSLASVKQDSIAFDNKWKAIDNTVIPEELTGKLVDYFSNDTTKDTLFLKVPQGKLGNTQSTITITKSNGKVIYQSQFPTKNLIYGYDATFDTTVYIAANGVKYLRTQVKEYFGKEIKLLSTLGTSDSVGLGDFISDTTTFFEVRANPRSRYFILHFGEEDNELMLYSPSKDTMVIVGGFD